MTGLQPFGGGQVARRPADLYPTEPAGTEAFLRVEGALLRKRFGTVWEPACGPGFMARVMECHGLQVVASDLNDWGYGRPGVDFLATRWARAQAVVTNPPYGELAEAFVRHAVLGLRLPYVALLLKSDFWHAGGRAPLFEAAPPALIYPLGFRLHWDGRGRPVQTHSWMVWDAERPAIARTMPALPKPDRWPDVGFEAFCKGVTP